MSYLFETRPPLRLGDTSETLQAWWDGTLTNLIDLTPNNNTDYQQKLGLYVKALLTYGHHLIKHHLYCDTCKVFVRHDPQPDVHRAHLLVFGKVQHDTVASAWRSKLNQEHVRLVRSSARANEVSLNLLMQEYLIFLTTADSASRRVFERDMFSPHIHLLAQLELIIQQSAMECLVKDHIGDDTPLSVEDATVMLGLRPLGNAPTPVSLRMITRCNAGV